MKVATFLPFAAIAIAAYVPSDPWTDLTPTTTLGSDSGATSSLPGSYALSIRTVSAASASTSAVHEKREDAANQIDDGQVQVQTTAASIINQISDGQIQAQTTEAPVVNQISDGQIQQQTADVVNQIDDGQVQQQTANVVNQIGDGQVQQQTAAVVNQIGDGQVQQQTANAVNQISDGQIQQNTADAAAQISDGQVQATPTQSVAAASQIGDGQVQATGTAAAEGQSDVAKTCVKSDSLFLQLKDGILTDKQGRIGAIVANRQFQFDGPPPQAGTIYAAGWAAVPIDFKEDSDTKEAADNAEKEKRDELYKLALGGQTTFYQCLSGSFYNLYDESIGGQCSEVEFVILEAVEC